MPHNCQVFSSFYSLESNRIFNQCQDPMDDVGSPSGSTKFSILSLNTSLIKIPDVFLYQGHSILSTRTCIFSIGSALMLVNITFAIVATTDMVNSQPHKAYL